MYKLKQIPEDFIVKEISTVQANNKGKYLYFKVTKRNRNTLDVVKELANRCNIKEKQIGFAGSKDKHAVTEQIISVSGVAREKISKTNIDNVTLEFMGLGSKPINLGDLEGNHFEIVVRNLEEVKIQKTLYCENYFDEQRFSQNNKEIGKHLIKKEFGKAIELIDNKQCNAHLAKNKNDFIGALQLLPIRLLRMYVNAYQSYLWNEAVSQYVGKKGTVVKKVMYSLGELVFIKEYFDANIPLIGFDTSTIENKEMSGIISTIMKKEGITYHDFIIKQIPPLTLEGELRPLFCKVKNLNIGPAEKDELNPKKKKVKLSFSLPKGSYATMVIKRLF